MGKLVLEKGGWAYCAGREGRGDVNGEGDVKGGGVDARHTGSTHQMPHQMVFTRVVPPPGAPGECGWVAL